MRRPRLQKGQVPFDFPVIRDFSQPSVVIHKNGRCLYFKPSDPVAADILREVYERLQSHRMRVGSFWKLNGVDIREFKKVEIWKHLDGDITKHPVCEVLRTFGVEIGASDSLTGYIRKEYRRQQVEKTAYPAPATTGTASLYERCSVGTNLRCVQDYRDPGTGAVRFTKDKHYLVVESGGNGTDAVRIATNELTDGATMKDNETAFDWSSFHPAMEEYFDDSEDAEMGLTVDQAFPESTARMKARLDKLGFSLYSHVSIDAAMEAQKRGTLNCKLMRMGKTSEAIAVTTLWGSKKIAVFGSQNVRLAWRKEFKRLGMTDYVMVDRLADLEKPGRYYLMKYSWILRMKDREAKARDNHEGYLRAGEREVRRKVEYQSKPDVITVFQHNSCPHCKQPMVRPALFVDDEWMTIRQGLAKLGPGLGVRAVRKVKWTTNRGYMCRNSQCSWTSDNRQKKGAAWHDKDIVVHSNGSYIDWGLAAHLSCPTDAVKGRLCTCCGEADGVWTPQVTKRFKKKFTAIVPDEIHNIKDITSQTAMAIYRMRARRKMGLTGTLLSNSALDAFWIMLWVFGGPNEQMPFGHRGKNQFDNRFCEHAILEKPTGQIDEETGQEIKKTVQRRLPYLKNPVDWWKFSAPKILRRNYKDPMFLQSLLDAGMHMPDWDIKLLKVQMTPQQVKLMLWALRDFKAIYEQAKAEAEAKGQELNKAFVMSQMTAMRIAATTPEFMNVRTKNPDLYQGPIGGGKMYPISTMAKNKILGGGKVLILSDYLSMQTAIQKELADYGVLRFNTSWGADKRQEAIDQFQEDPDVGGMVAGTRAVSEALDFSAADTVICCDLLWSPAFQSQAWSRILAPTARKRVCEIFLTLAQNTIDEYMYTVFYSKMVAAEQAMDRKVLNRRALDVDIKWFAERVLEEESNLRLQLRDFGVPEDNMIVLPDMNDGLYEERVA